nr:NADH dehydrogenase subunit 2 [Microdeuterus sp. HEM078]
MNKSKMMFSVVLIMSTMLTLSSNNWISMWMGLEMNMMAFMPLVINKNYYNSSVAAMSYFMVQSVSSLVLMFAMMIKNKHNLFNEVMMMSLLMKLGSAPFHMWVPEVMSKMSWMNCLILSTWQKIAPLMMLMNMNKNNMMLTVVIMMSAIIGAVGGMNQSSIRKIMGYSSINHLSWMMMSTSTNSWVMYFMIYSIMMSLVCYMFNNYKIMFINQFNNMSMTNMEKMSLSVTMLSMGGLPPFLGFLPKWIVIQNMVEEENFMVMTVMIMMSLITLMYYMRITMKMSVMSASTQKWMVMNSSTMMNISIIITNMSLPLMMIMNFK